MMSGLNRYLPEVRPRAAIFSIETLEVAGTVISASPSRRATHASLASFMPRGSLASSSSSGSDTLPLTLTTHLPHLPWPPHGIDMGIEAAKRASFMVEPDTTHTSLESGIITTRTDCFSSPATPSRRRQSIPFNSTVYR
jgi:hypothetical protein